MESHLQLLTYLLATALSGAPVQPSPAVLQAVGAVLQADGKRALASLAGTDPATLSAKDQATVLCMRQRLTAAEQPAAGPPPDIADRALAIYRSYWVSAMARPESRKAEERRLAEALRNLLGAPPADDMDALEPKLANALSKAGYHSLQGETGLLRELTIWSKEDSRLFRVALPEEEREVKVELLDGFKSYGWSNWMTCGRASTGGWTTDEALFAVVPRYPSLDSEEFQVTFLGHEAQHFADKAHFKGLENWELEYRAKLTELAKAETTRAKVLGRFVMDQGDDPASPHSYANRRVLNDMVAKLHLKSPAELTTADGAAVQAAAVALLRADTRRRAGTRR